VSVCTCHVVFNPSPENVGSPCTLCGSPTESSIEPVRDPLQRRSGHSFASFETCQNEKPTYKTSINAYKTRSRDGTEPRTKHSLRLLKAREQVKPRNNKHYLGCSLVLDFASKGTSIPINRAQRLAWEAQRCLRCRFASTGLTSAGRSWTSDPSR